MTQILFSWIGTTDLRAAEGDPPVGVGPIAQAVNARSFGHVVLISDWSADRSAHYVAWLRERSTAPVVVYDQPLTGPTEFGEIYHAAVAVVSDFLRANPSMEPVFHLSPGTPAMAAVWIILAKTRFSAELIESSLQHGVRTASVPFDISAELIPDLLRRPDAELQRLSTGLPPEAPEFEEIVHRSTEMRRVLARARRVAPRTLSVLLEGESGTGKELLARAIHRSSGRVGKFVAVNCGAIPSELVESQLFGHKRGAFTGAVADHTGYFEAAHGGTLFLDEIGELPIAAQVKLLRVLQERQVTRVGETTPRVIDVRVIAATNRSLVREVVAGRFREDLFYRLAVVVLHLPPLRERTGDIGLIAERLLAQINEESRTEPGYQPRELTVAARNFLLSQPWVGNVRELQNTLRRAAVWSEDQEIGVEDLRDAMLPMPNTAGSGSILGRALGSGFSLADTLAEVARHYLDRALLESGGNKTRAAELVGLGSYQTFTNWMERYGVTS